MPRRSIAVVFAGSGGSGAMTAGAVFLRTAARAGYFGMMTQLFGAQVRGGESAALVQIGVDPVEAQPDRFDVFVALDWDKVEQFAAEIPLDETSLILADSGPGFSLMVESLGLAVAAEIPLLLVDVMRAGPSTGIASKTEQSDINLAIYGTHGDAPRVVLAPLSVGDCAGTTEYAVYVAEALQVPVIVLSDQLLGQATTAIDPVSDRPLPRKRKTDGTAPGQPFKRYATGGEAITPMPSPGTPDREWVAEGLTHNEAGLPASGAAVHAAQIHKRARKIREFDAGERWGEVTGEGDTAILAFGSTVGAAREAARRLGEAGRKVRVVALRLLSPLPVKQLAQALTGVRRVVVIEQNDSGQLYRHLLGHNAVPVDAESVARPGPLPFRPSEIVNYVA